MRKCTFCNEEYNDDWYSCPKCGRVLSNDDGSRVAEFTSSAEKANFIKKTEGLPQDTNLIYEIDGNMGKFLKVYSDRCIISTKTNIKSALYGSLLNGDKEFYYKDITSVQFKNLGITSGYLQFEYPGSHSGNNFVSENSFTFSATIGTEKHKRLKEEMPKIYEDIRHRINETKNTKTDFSIATISAADEIKKFKELLDEGIITQAEFDAKKKLLLSL